MIIAKEVAPYRHARLSSMKVGTDRTNVPAAPSNMTEEELRAEILADTLHLGILPPHIYKLLSESGDVIECQGAVDAGHNGVARN